MTTAAPAVPFDPISFAPSVQALGTYLERHVCQARADDLANLLGKLNTFLTQAPGFDDDDDALGDLPDLADWGLSVSGLPLLNLLMASILQDRQGFLASPASITGFRIEGAGWLSPTAKARYGFAHCLKDAASLPYWRSWHAFLTRSFTDPGQARPLCDPDSNHTVISPNDGTQSRSGAGLTLADVLGSSIPAQQATIDAFGLVALFSDGYRCQSHLSACDFQRWCSPVSGRVLFDPFTIPGTFFAAPGRARSCGIIVIETEEHGHVCCLPRGTIDAASVAFDPALRAGTSLRKGQALGMFNDGGSSFATLYQKMPGKTLVFATGDTVRAGARIGAWQAGP